MNNFLKKQIILHVLNQFGIFRKNKNNWLDPFLQQKKLKFEIEEDVYERSLWCGEINVDNSLIQFLLADISGETKEFVVILQLDSFPPYVMRLSEDAEDYGSMYFEAEGAWINAPTLLQGKVLIALETIYENLLTWEPSKNIDGIYKTLISFLKFDADE
jgi:hypothetical protein